METEVVSQVVDIAPLFGYGLEALGGLLMAVAIWAVTKYGKKLGLEEDEKVRNYLLDAVENAIDYGTNKAKEELRDAEWTEVELKNKTLHKGAEYVMKRVPDAVKRFKLDEEGVKDMVLAKLEKRQTQALPAPKEGE